MSQTQHLDGRRGLQGWQWLFVRLYDLTAVGVLKDYRSSSKVSDRPVLVSSPVSDNVHVARGAQSLTLTGYFMPDWPSTTRWLSGEERILAAQRLAYDGVSFLPVETPLV